MAGLTAEQVQRYRDDGYLLVEGVFDPSVADELKAELSSRVDTFAHSAHGEGRLRDLHGDELFPTRMARIAEEMVDPADGLRQLNGKLRTKGMFRILTEPSLVDIVESVIGPEILAHPQFNVRAKLPNQDSTVVPWHQDLGYLQPDAEETFMVNFWIPLVDATQENGCLEVIAGSHRTPLFEHEHGLGPGGNFKGIRDEHLPDGKQVLCPVREGGVLLIQHKTFHRSLPNTSQHIRWSLDLRYSDPDMPTGRAGVPGFIARSGRDPESVCASAVGWNRIVDAAGTPAGS
ncbi:MAG: phytanoyl-CoA dioxygenase family protein [Candidatus Latescibacterota bacterium]|nr:phytanoyl-CoA dioxygenase family protein [Candidatus Latescibacterota bacterium]